MKFQIITLNLFFCLTFPNVTFAASSNSSGELGRSQVAFIFGAFISQCEKSYPLDISGRLNCVKRLLEAANNYKVGAHREDKAQQISMDYDPIKLCQQYPNSAWCKSLKAKGLVPVSMGPEEIRAILKAEFSESKDEEGKRAIRHQLAVLNQVFPSVSTASQNLSSTAAQ